MKIEFRRVRPSDARQLEKITHAAYVKWVPAIGRRPKPMETAYADAIVKHIVEVIELRGRCIGVLELHIHPEFLLLENIAISPEMQGFGIGPRALLHCEEVARDLSKRALRLYTNKAFASNISFYEKRGFTEIREELLPDGGLLVHFEKLISGEPQGGQS